MFWKKLKKGETSMSENNETKFDPVTGQNVAQTSQPENPYVTGQNVAQAPQPENPYVAG